MLASCGFDKSIKIWQQIKSSDNNYIFILKAKMQEFSPSDSVEDITFAPKIYGKSKY